MKITILLFFHLHFSKCETCCSVKELVSATNPSASGRYVLVGHSSALKTINSRCSSGCVYVKQGDSSDTQYCFQPSQQGTSACAENCQNSPPAGIIFSRQHYTDVFLSHSQKPGSSKVLHSP